MPESDQIQLIRAIRGAPATVLLLLVVRGVSMTNLEICRFTGYSDKPVTAAVGLLESLGVLQYNGRANGWSIAAGTQRLLPLRELLEDSYPQPVDKEIGESPIYVQEIGNIPISASTTTTTTTVGREVAVAAEAAVATRVDRRNSDLRDRKKSDLRPGDRKISDLLVRGGIGRNSKKYRELMAADLDPETVAAHVEARLARPEEIPVGLLIRKLLDGDPAPPRKKEEAAYFGLNRIPHHLVDVIEH